jgi:hypothetical protein
MPPAAKKIKTEHNNNNSSSNSNSDTDPIPLTPPPPRIAAPVPMRPLPPLLRLPQPLVLPPPPPASATAKHAQHTMGTPPLDNELRMKLIQDVAQGLYNIQQQKFINPTLFAQISTAVSNLPQYTHQPTQSLLGPLPPLSVLGAFPPANKSCTPPLFPLAPPVMPPHLELADLSVPLETKSSDIQFGTLAFTSAPSNNKTPSPQIGALLAPPFTVDAKDASLMLSPLRHSPASLALNSPQKDTLDPTLFNMATTSFSRSLAPHPFLAKFAGPSGAKDEFDPLASSDDEMMK